LAAERLVELNDSLTGMKNNRKRKKYTKKVQKYIEEEFSEELKKLTRTEGQILVKLIYRQTGTTAFDLVKDLRNGWRAFWYNTTAKLFKISIKEEFHPDVIEEDYLIEDILQRAFSKGKLERQATVLDYDYDKLYNKWKKTTKLPKG
jgi:NADPH:quinone reductase-like Zn-dependent oxidoreductase